MVIQQTSLEAYQTVNCLGHKRKMVYEAISKMGSACNQNIAKYLGWSINCVTPRTNELVRYGLVEMDRKDVGPTGKRVIYWRCVQ